MAEPALSIYRLEKDHFLRRQEPHRYGLYDRRPLQEPGLLQGQAHPLPCCAQYRYRPAPARPQLAGGQIPAEKGDGHSMLKEERLDHIIGALKRADRITYEGMAAELKVSE